MGAEGYVGIAEVGLAETGFEVVAEDGAGFDTPEVPRYGMASFGGGTAPCLCAGELVVLRETGAETVATGSTRGALVFKSLPTSSAFLFGGRFVDDTRGRAAVREPLSLRINEPGLGTMAELEGFVALGAGAEPPPIEERIELRSC